jgi:hypothetical protein
MDIRWALEGIELEDMQLEDSQLVHIQLADIADTPLVDNPASAPDPVADLLVLIQWPLPPAAFSFCIEHNSKFRYRNTSSTHPQQ